MSRVSRRYSVWGHRWATNRKQIATILLIRFFDICESFWLDLFSNVQLVGHDNGNLLHQCLNEQLLDLPPHSLSVLSSHPLEGFLQSAEIGLDVIRLGQSEGGNLLPMAHQFPSCLLEIIEDYVLIVEGGSLVRKGEAEGLEGLPGQGEEVALGFIAPDSDPDQGVVGGILVGVEQDVLGVYGEHENQVADDSVELPEPVNGFLPIHLFHHQIVLLGPLIKGELTLILLKIPPQSLIRLGNHRRRQIRGHILALCRLLLHHKRQQQPSPTSNLQHILGLLDLQLVQQSEEEGLWAGVHGCVHIRELIPSLQDAVKGGVRCLLHFVYCTKTTKDISEHKMITNILLIGYFDILGSCGFGLLSDVHHVGHQHRDLVRQCFDVYLLHSLLCSLYVLGGHTFEGITHLADVRVEVVRLGE